jgi:hypothetical protein
MGTWYEILIHNCYFKNVYYRPKWSTFIQVGENHMFYPYVLHILKNQHVSFKCDSSLRHPADRCKFCFKHRPDSTSPIVTSPGPSNFQFVVDDEIFFMARQSQRIRIVWCHCDNVPLLFKDAWKTGVLCRNLNNTRRHIQKSCEISLNNDKNNIRFISVPRGNSIQQIWTA